LNSATPQGSWCVPLRLAAPLRTFNLAPHGSRVQLLLTAGKNMGYTLSPVNEEQALKILPTDEERYGRRARQPLSLLSHA
jgi:hypothetical protein